MKHALICYNERDVLWNVHARVKALRDEPGGKVQVFALFFFFFTGVALVLVILLFYVLFTCYFDYLFLHELFSLEFRLAQFLSPKIHNGQSPTKLGKMRLKISAVGFKENSLPDPVL